MQDGRDGPCSSGASAICSLVHVNKVAVFMAVCWVRSLRAETVGSLRSFRETYGGSSAGQWVQRWVETGQSNTESRKKGSEKSRECTRMGVVGSRTVLR